MSRETVDIIRGKVQKDIYGSWDDCSPGLYVGSDHIENILDDWRGKRVKITIEEIKDDENLLED
ncbi:MAG: hypothetical protein M0R03_08635 [Novosphingobium sp.]|nr:hypothetical protein [Novosphingobium sp.]